MKRIYSPPSLLHYGPVSAVTGYETLEGDEDDYLDASGNPLAHGGGSQDGCVFKQGTTICDFTDNPDV